MKKKLAGLVELVGTDTLVRLDRKPLDAFLHGGFVVGLSKRFLLLHAIDGDSALLNGYVCIRLKDIRRYHVDDSSMERALRLLGRCPVVPANIDLSDWPSVLRTANEQYPLIMIEREEVCPNKGYVGRFVRYIAGRIEFDEIDPQSEPEGIFFYAKKEITRVSFGDGYVDALIRLAEYERHLRNSE